MPAILICTAILAQAPAVQDVQPCQAVVIQHGMGASVEVSRIVEPVGRVETQLVARMVDGTLVLVGTSFVPKSNGTYLAFIVDFDLKTIEQRFYRVSSGPEPPPDETGKWGLTTLSRTSLEQVSAAARKAHQQDTSILYQSVVSAIRAGDYGALTAAPPASKVETVDADLRERLKSEWGDHLKAWKPWYNAVHARINARWQSDTSTWGDYADALLSISEGLE